MFNKKIIYVCSPLKGDIDKNVANAKQYCKSVVTAGYVPLAPHVALNGVLDDNIPNQRAIALDLGLEILWRCDELWVFGDLISEGMSMEIGTAKKLNIPVKRVINDNVQ